ncbi:peptidylprolyl isomerase [Candidatus Altiarchaeota archaeon]
MDETQKKGIFVGLIVFFVIAAFGIYQMGYDEKPGKTGITTQTTLAQELVAEAEDIATINYIGTYENGSVFDTSYQDIAKEAGVYNPLRTYTPLTFTIGTGGLLPAFEDTVIGMRIGEEKTFTLTPEKAYGYPDPQLIVTEPKKQVSDRIQNVTLEKFLEDVGIEPAIGLEFNITNDTGYTMSWPMEVVNMTNDTVIIKHNPPEDFSFNTAFGPAVVELTDDNIIVNIDAKDGKIVTIYGPAYVTTNEENYTVDFNHELAGKTISFKIKMEMLVKQ